jgi:hypothetical protein
MDSIKIFARPHDLDKLLQRVISFGVSVRQSILVRRQVAGNDVGTSVKESRECPINLRRLPGPADI